MRFALIIAFSIGLFTVQVLPAGEHWPGWRGPTGMGITDEAALPTTWGGKDAVNVLWKAPLFPSDKVRRDQNQSSPIVWGERVIVTLSYWPEGVSEKEYPEHHVLCFRTRDGMKLWEAKVAPGPWKLTDLRGGYTAPTPACDGERIYVVFGSSVIAALSMEGKPIWRKEITPHHFDVAIGASPVVFQDTVIFVSDQMRDKKTSSILAYDAWTGATRWQVSRPDADWAHTTPTLARIGDRWQLLVASAAGPQGLDPTNGKSIWSCLLGSGRFGADRFGDTVSPVLGKDVVYIDCGRSGPAAAVDPTGTGDVSKTHLRWKLKSVPEGFSSPVIVGDLLYRLHNPGVLVSYRLADGKEVQRERLEGLDHAVSPIVTRDSMIYCASAGTSYVIKAGERFEVLARNELGDASKASAAVAAGRLYLRGGRFLYCVGNKR